MKFQMFLLLFILTACNSSQKHIKDYEKHIFKYISKEFISVNGDFSIFLPENWFKNEDSTRSKTHSYSLQTGPKSKNVTGFFAMTIFKMKLIKGSINNEFDLMIDAYLKRVGNLELIEKSKIKIGKKDAKIAHLAFTNEGKTYQEEIDIFIPLNSNEYYNICLISDKNEHIENNLGLLLQIAKTFKIK